MSAIFVNYVTQISTWSGLIKLACALGLLTAAPDVQNQLSTDAVQFITGVLALLGAIDVLRDERKGSTLPDNSTQLKG